MSVLLAFTAAALFATGTFLLLQRRLSRILIGIGLIGHGTNLLLVISGGEGGIAPIIGTGDQQDFSDPLPQAFALTSIVITFGVTAFLLALAFRSWQMTHDDVVEDDVEDRYVARRAQDDFVLEGEAAERAQAAEEDRSWNALIPLPIIVPLLGAALCVIAARRRWAQRIVVLAALTGNLVVSIVLLVRVQHDGIGVTQAGGWPAPLGISLVVDDLAGIMLVVSSIMLLTVFVYAIGEGQEESRYAAFGSVYLVLAAGVSASFITGDLFNLFVAFELMLVASYVLLTLGGRPGQVRAGMSYVVISLIASTFFVVALALIYAATGTVNMAELAVRMPELDHGVRVGFSLLLIVVFGIKAGLFPLFFWLPDSYPTAPTAITAVFAGLLTKVGVYAIIRSQTLLFPADAQQGTLLLVVAGLTMVVGVLGAIAQDDLRRMLSFHIVSHIGYMIFGLALFTLSGIAGAVFYIVHHIVVKSSLFLVAGLAEFRAGTDRLSRLGGMVRSAPTIAVLFALPALSIAGIPPFSGFVGKFALVDAGIQSEKWVIVAVSLTVSLLTVYVMGRIWSSVFWGEADPATQARLASATGRIPVLMLGSTVVLVVLGLAIMVFAGPLYDLAERTATQLLDPSQYVDAVLRGRS